MRHFVSLRDPAGEAELRHWLAARPDDLGRVLARHKVPAASRPITLLLALAAAGLAVLLVATIVAVAAGWIPAAALICPVIGVLGVLVLVVPLFLVQHDSRDIEVREHGLVVGSRPVPFATMDPGRFVWATRASASRAVVTLLRRRRVAGGDCLILSGTDGPDAVNDWQASWVGGKYDPLPHAPRLDTPFVWWVLGPKDVGAFVHDLESAMVADGFAVQGLAGWLGSHRVDVPTGAEAYPRRAPLDPPLWRT